MKYDPDIHHRRSIRLKGYDYSSPGAYFVTTVTRKRECLFGEVVEGSVHLSKMGVIVQQVWLDSPNRYSYVVLDAFCIMPNHIHGIIILTDTLGGAGLNYNGLLLQTRFGRNQRSNPTHPGPTPTPGMEYRKLCGRSNPFQPAVSTDYRSGSAIIMNVSSAMKMN